MSTSVRTMWVPRIVSLNLLSPASLASRSAWRSFGARAASRAMVSVTYLRAVAVAVPYPVASSTSTVTMAQGFSTWPTTSDQSA